VRRSGGPPRKMLQGSGTEEGGRGPQLRREDSTRINYLQGSRVPSYATAHGPVCLISRAGVKSQFAPAGSNVDTAIILSSNALHV